MNEEQTSALAELPGGLRSAVGRLLASDESVLLAAHLPYSDVLTWPGEERLPDYRPSLAWVVTSRQVLALASGPHSALPTYDAAVPLLVVQRSDLLMVEYGETLLTGWLEVTRTSGSHVVRDRLRAGFSYLDLIGASVRLLGGNTRVLPAPAFALYHAVPAWFRTRAQSLLEPGEGVVTVLHAPAPAAPVRVLRRRPPAETPRHALLVTEDRFLQFERPGGPAGRHELISRVFRASDLDDVWEDSPRSGVTSVHLRLARGDVNTTVRIDLDDAAREGWEPAFETIRDMRRRQVATPLDTERRRFVGVTGLGDLTVTEPMHYRILLAHIREYRRSQEAEGRALSLREAATEWRAATYAPLAERLAESPARSRVPERTLPDLFIRMCHHKWLTSERLGHDIGLDAALDEFERWAM